MTETLGRAETTGAEWTVEDTIGTFHNIYTYYMI
jgi:hypothetical protein